MKKFISLFGVTSLLVTTPLSTMAMSKKNNFVVENLVPNQDLYYNYNYEIKTGGGVSKNHTNDKKTAILNGRRYASDGSEFQSIYGKGQYEKKIVYNIKADAGTNFYASDYVDKTIKINMYAISESEVVLNEPDSSVNLEAYVGTSKVKAEFGTSFYRDDNYIYVNVHFYLKIASFQTREVSMNAYVGGLRFE